MCKYNLQNTIPYAGWLDYLHSKFVIQIMISCHCSVRVVSNSLSLYYMTPNPEKDNPAISNINVVGCEYQIKSECIKR